MTDQSCIKVERHPSAWGNAMSQGRDFQAGDLVHFGHDDVSVYTVARVVFPLGPREPMIELKELPGQFAPHLFRSAKCS